MPEQREHKQRIDLLRRSVESTLRYLDRQAQVMADTVDQALAVESEGGDDPQADDEAAQPSALYTEAMEVLRDRRRELASAFRHEIKRSARHFLDADKHPTSKGNTDDLNEWTLELLDDNQLEEQLAVDGVVGKARRRYEDQLRRLDGRLVKLIDSLALDPEAHPAEPKVFCEAFAQAIQPLELELPIKLKLLRLFEHYVIAELDEMYREIDRMFDQWSDTFDLTPDIGARHHAQPAAMTTTAAPSQAAQGPQELQAPQGPAVQQESAPVPGQQAPPTTAGGQPAGGDTKDILRLLQTLVAQTSSHNRGSGGGAMAGAAPAAGTGTASSGAAEQEGQGVAADTGQLVAALSRLQRQAPQQEDSGLEGEELKTGVLRDLQTVDAEGEERNIGETEDKTIDVVSMLFDYVLSDAAIPESVKGLIARLQIPVVKVALLEPSFFGAAEHPARRLINTLSQASVGLDDTDEREGAAVVEEVRQVVEHITEEFESDTSLFEQARENFEARIAEIRSGAQERERQAVQRIARRDEQAAAKALATESIDELIGSAQLPAVIDDFLRSGWRDLLARIYLRHGSDSQAWRRGLNVASLLVWSLLPKRTRFERDQLLRILPGLLKAVRSGVGHLRLPAADIEAFMTELAREHARNVRGELGDTESQIVATDEEMATEASAEAVVDDAPGTLETAQQGQQAASDAGPMASATQTHETQQAAVDQESWLSLEPDEPEESEAPETPSAEQRSDILADRRTFMQRKVEQIERMVQQRRARQHAGNDEAPAPESQDDTPGPLQQVRSMATGTWVELHDVEEGPVHAKLAWKGRISGEYFFFNRRGIQVAVRQEEQLAEAVGSGQVVFLEEARVLDRAMDAMLSDLQSNAGYTSGAA